MLLTSLALIGSLSLQQTINNPEPKYSLCNSVDYHPKEPLFCVAYTQNNKVVLYRIDAKGHAFVFQSLSNPSSQLKQPQHAVFSPDGDKMVVANWTDGQLAVYERMDGVFFRENPAAVFAAPSSLSKHKPHGIAFSPCGKYLAIAYGAASYYPRALAIFNGQNCALVHLLEELPGTPKGIAFSPDGTHLLVTFSDTNSLVVFEISKSEILLPKQTIEEGLSRPEDVKITADGAYCAVTNSDKSTVAFYPFDKKKNRVTQYRPSSVLGNLEAGFQFPHGIAFSPDGVFMVVTNFGEVGTTEAGDVVWDRNAPPQGFVNLYRLLGQAGEGDSVSYSFR